MSNTLELVRTYSKNISQAACALESRWTYAALRRVSADIASRLHDQRNLWAEVCISGNAREIEEQGDALLRGYAIATAELEKSGASDDAYLLGSDLVTGTKVAIGTQRAAIPRIRAQYGNDVIWLTPDEVARILSEKESFKAIGALKRLWPGAEVLDNEDRSDGTVED